MSSIKTNDWNNRTKNFKMVKSHKEKKMDPNKIAYVIKLEIDGNIEYLAKLNKSSFRTSPYLWDAQLFRSNSLEIQMAHDKLKKFNPTAEEIQ